MRVLYALIAIPALSLLLMPFSYAQTTNVSLLYGWNGTVWTPLRTDAAGTLMSTLNLTESVGMNPQLDNSYDLGNTTFRWRNIYGMNSFVNSFLGINTTTVAGIVRVAVNGSSVFSINETGRVGINVTNPTGLFHVTAGGQANAFVITTTDGNVGIGTATPNQKLTVAGDLNVSGALITNQNITNIDTIGNMIVGRNLTVSNNVLFVNNATERVGIGTTGPLERLHLVGNIFVNNTGVATSTAAFNSSDIILQNSAWNGTIATLYNATLRHIATNGTGNLTRLGVFVNGSERVSIDSLGNVGIGLANPAQTLTVVGTGNFTSTLWAGSTITGINGLTISAGTISLPANSISQNTLAGMTWPAANVSAGTFASGLFTFQNNLTVAQNLTAGNTLWVDSAVKKVGINTTSPSGILQVNVNGSDVFHINETGNVGIGTTGPAAKLDVNGSARLGNSTNSYVAVSGNGVLTYTGDAQPKRTIVMTASGGTPATTNGADSQQLETSTNKVNYYVLDYDPSTIEYATWQFTVPDSYTGTTATAKLYWQTAGTSGDAVWAVQSAGFTDTTAMDSAWGAAASVTDTAGGSANVLLVTSETSAITTGWTAGGLGMVRAYRNATAGGDTLASDARLISVRMEWTASADSD